MKDVQSLTVSRTSIWRYRMENRKKMASKVKKTFNPTDAMILHWDGKVLPEIAERKMVDRIAVVISQADSEQLLGVPKIENGTGTNLAEAVCGLMTQRIQAVCADTTASNTGRLNGACFKMEQFLGLDLLFLACRHHMYELILKTVFELKISSTSGPVVPMFNRFQQQWANIDKIQYRSGMQNTYIANHLNGTS